ncbi:gamma-glutamylcyclotransferase family protein [Occallatibacter savannae]|uniref:gamma-glutamylcyclotransferase family protein n=1 Tax=Occallatibacter savannae TaxID=1002691 RepID=UPI000D688FC7|nr:gamma-glutamylcyclotransferase family protein [Occallatibacter savannae]
MPDANTRLATYGSLSPGEINHNQLSDLKGRWLKGTVRGILHNAGWGDAMGFPGLILNPAGPEVPVNIFESDELPQRWARLDEFEGSEYRRVTAQVLTADGLIEAQIYVIA